MENFFGRGVGGNYEYKMTRIIQHSGKTYLQDYIEQ